MWTQFWDMSSGGSQKEKWHFIYIEAPKEEATIIFYNRFHHSPYRVSCTCCGEDYSISEGESLAQLTGYHRNCAYDRENGGYIEEPDRTYRHDAEVIPLEEYLKDVECLFIYAWEIKPEEKVGEVPIEGFIWV